MSVRHTHAHTFAVWGLLCSGAMLPLGCSPLKAAPGHVVPPVGGEVVRDLGVVSPGSEHRLEVSLQNHSAETVRVLQVGTSCRCAIAEVLKPVAEPQQAVRLSVSYRAPQEPRDDRRELWVDCTGTPPTRTVIVLQAKVRAALSVSARELAFGRVAVGSSALRTLRIENHSGADWPDVRLGPMPAGFVLESPPRLLPAARSTARQQWEAVLAARPGPHDRGRQRGSVSVQAGAEAERIELSSWVDAALATTPAQLFWEPSDKAGGTVRSLVVTPADPAGRFDPAAWRVEVEPYWSLTTDWVVLSPRQARLNLVLSPSAATPSRGTLRLVSVAQPALTGAEVPLFLMEGR